MNHDDTERSRAWTWVMYVLALPVLYLLSVPPVHMAADRLTPTRNTPPPWASFYAGPYEWVQQETGLKNVLERYRAFWDAVAYPGRRRMNHFLKGNDQ